MALLCNEYALVYPGDSGKQVALDSEVAGGGGGGGGYYGGKGIDESSCTNTETPRQQSKTLESTISRQQSRGRDGERGSW